MSETPAAPEPTADGFYPTVPAEDIQEKGLKTVMVADNPVVLTRIDNKIHAFTAICPHAFAHLGHGRIVGNEVECPVHGWYFCVTGEESDTGMPLDCYQVREEDGTVYVNVG
ncbi:MAG: Rieske 2Fe-2S domain-containing protein [Chloroflexota bacterium]